MITWFTLAKHIALNFHAKWHEFDLGENQRCRECIRNSTFLYVHEYCRNSLLCPIMWVFDSEKHRCSSNVQTKTKIKIIQFSVQSLSSFPSLFWIDFYVWLGHWSFCLTRHQETEMVAAFCLIYTNIFRVNAFEKNGTRELSFSCSK